MMMNMEMIQFVSIVTVIQMQLMKVNNKMKKIENKEFRHCVESKSIEVMMTKMRMIQSVSIMNLIQMKLKKVIRNLKNIMNRGFQHCVK
jgi:RNA polymerase-binding transcription factor DksA